MPIIDGKKYACQKCINGHRGASCTHTDPATHLVEIRPRGRPSTRCKYCRTNRLRRTSDKPRPGCTCSGTHSSLCLPTGVGTPSDASTPALAGPPGQRSAISLGYGLDQAGPSHTPISSTHLLQDPHNSHPWPSHPRVSSWAATTTSFHPAGSGIPASILTSCTTGPWVPDLPERRSSLGLPMDQVHEFARVHLPDQAGVRTLGMLHPNKPFMYGVNGGDDTSMACASYSSQCGDSSSYYSHSVVMSGGTASSSFTLTPPPSASLTGSFSAPPLPLPAAPCAPTALRGTSAATQLQHHHAPPPPSLLLPPHTAGLPASSDGTSGGRDHPTDGGPLIADEAFPALSRTNSWPPSSTLTVRTQCLPHADPQTAPAHSHYYHNNNTVNNMNTMPVSAATYYPTSTSPSTSIMADTPPPDAAVGDTHGPMMMGGLFAPSFGPHAARISTLHTSAPHAPPWTDSSACATGHQPVSVMDPQDTRDHKDLSAHRTTAGMNHMLAAPTIKTEGEVRRSAGAPTPPPPFRSGPLPLRHAALLPTLSPSSLAVYREPLFHTATRRAVVRPGTKLPPAISVMPALPPGRPAHSASAPLSAALPPEG